MSATANTGLLDRYLCVELVLGSPYNKTILIFCLLSGFAALELSGNCSGHVISSEVRARNLHVCCFRKSELGRFLGLWPRNDMAAE